MNVNRKIKDSVFSLLFSNPGILRELYCAIEGIELPPDIPISINTLSGVILRKQINDISFTIDKRLVVLIEHQSTINNNMPVRLLLYIARVYEKIIDIRKRYHRKLISIPKPEFIVLYNGIDPYPDHSELYLSDAFKDTENLETAGNLEIPLELKVHVYNIKKGHNPEIQEKCKTLSDYSYFIDKIQEYQKMDFVLEKAAISAVKYCIKNKILKDFLETHSSEVVNMLLEEYDYEEELSVLREEAREDGFAEGRAEGRAEIIALLKQGLSLEEIEQR